MQTLKNCVSLPQWSKPYPISAHHGSSSAHWQKYKDAGLWDASIRKTGLWLKISASFCSEWSLMCFCLLEWQISSTYSKFWSRAHQQLVRQFPDGEKQLNQLFKVLCNTEDVAGYAPASVGDSEQWSSIASVAEDNRQNYCKAWTGKTLFSALYGMYTFALQEFKILLKASTPAGQTKTLKLAATQEDGFQEVWRRKRHSTH
jgi:hypothetical protein